MIDFLPTMPGIVARIIGQAARAAIDTESDFWEQIQIEHINWQNEFVTELSDIEVDRQTAIVNKVWADIQKLMNLPTLDQPTKE